MQKYSVELCQRVNRVIQQGLAIVYCAEPIGLQEFPYTTLDFLLLGVQPALPALDARHEVRNSNAQRSYDPGTPRLLGRSITRLSFNFRQTGEQGLCEQGEAFTRKGVVT